MTKTRLSGLAVLLCAALVGCGGGSISINDLKGAVADSNCDRLVRCGAVSSHDACVALLNSFFNEDELQADVANGTVKYDGEKAQSCLDALGGSSCDVSQKDNRVTPQDCIDAIKGTVADGGSCKNDGQCISQSCNVPTNCGQACCAGTCDPTPPKAVAIGQSCATAPCVDGAYCDTSATCAALVASGAACTGDDMCAYGTVCAGATGSTTCVAAPKAGDTCLTRVSGGNKCVQTGLACDATNHCIKLLASGATCDPQAALCQEDLACDPTAMTCGGLPGNGQPCPGFECSPGNYCQVDAQFNPTTCAPLKDDNAACQQSFECKSGSCDQTAHTCTAATVCS